MEETKILIYTTTGCPACQTMKSSLNRLRVEYTEIRLKNGMTVPRDVRSFPTLAMEKNGKRTTICTGWPGSFDQLKKRLEALKKQSPLKGTKKQEETHDTIKKIKTEPVLRRRYS